MAPTRTSNCIKSLNTQDQQLLIRVPLPHGGEVEVIVRPCLGTKNTTRLHLVGPPSVSYETVARELKPGMT